MATVLLCALLCFVSLAGVSTSADAPVGSRRPCDCGAAGQKAAEEEGRRCDGRWAVHSVAAIARTVILIQDTPRRHVNGERAAAGMTTTDAATVDVGMTAERLHPLLVSGP